MRNHNGNYFKKQLEMFSHQQCGVLNLSNEVILTTISLFSVEVSFKFGQNFFIKMCDGLFITKSCGET